MLKNQKVEKTMEMARNKGAKYFDVTSVSHLTKKILDKGAYWLKSPKKYFGLGIFLGAISGLLNHVTQKFLKKKS